MTRSNFDASLKYVLAHEGGYVNHPDDPGGATNLGITIGTLSQHLGRKATTTDVKNISLTTASAIYRANYWDRARCDDLPSGLDYAVFDFAVNSGVSRAVQTLQKVLGVKQDGVIGPKTLAAIDTDQVLVVELIARLCAERMAFLKRLKTWGTFGKGWTRRVMGERDGAQDADTGVIDRASRMAVGMKVIKAPPARLVDDGASARAPEEDESEVSKMSDPALWGTIGTVVTGALTAGAGDGPLSWAIAAVLVIAAIGALIWIARRK